MLEAYPTTNKEDNITEFKFCACNCGQKVKNNKYNFILNHNKKGNKFNWKGGRILVDGYYYLYLPNHPYATKRGYYLEHRKVMEDSIGRVLDPKEVVHHIDKNPINNKIENLKLYSSHGEHLGTEHNPKLDMSERFCLLCKSNKTGMETKKKTGKSYPKWIKFENGFICRKCHDARVWKKKQEEIKKKRGF